MIHIERIHNIQTGEVTEIERLLTSEEIAEIEAAEASLVAALEAEKQKQQAKTAAEEKLTALGLTPEDLAALLS